MEVCTQIPVKVYEARKCVLGSDSPEGSPEAVVSDSVKEKPSLTCSMDPGSQRCQDHGICAGGSCRDQVEICGRLGVGSGVRWVEIGHVDL